jgi:hypothetical protein
MQAQSLVARQAMIEEAKILGAAPVLRVDAVRALQQRWQAQAHEVPIDRRQEQKLWDAFRKPIDDAFNRKTAEREKADAALGARDRTVLQAAKAVEAANAAGDAQAIRAAVAALEAALHGQAQAQQDVKAAGAQEGEAQAAAQASAAASGVSESNEAVAPVDSAQGAPENVASEERDGETPAPAAPVKPAPKPVVAMRGDDRPGMRKDVPAPATGKGAKWGERKAGMGASRDGKPGERPRDRNDAAGGRAPAAVWQEAPRLGDTAFRAQREAMENAQYALKKLAAQAHGEALTQLLTAWEKRDATLVPSAHDLGSRATTATRSAWLQAVAGNLPTAAKAPSPQEALLRLEMAAEVPTPAEDIGARRNLQLQLLTRRNDPSPVETWGQDAAVVLAGEFNAPLARRVQNVLKVLLKK